MSSAVLVSQNSLTGHSHPGLPGAVLPPTLCALDRPSPQAPACSSQYPSRVEPERSRVQYSCIAKTQVLVSRVQVHSR